MFHFLLSGVSFPCLGRFLSRHMPLSPRSVSSRSRVPSLCSSLCSGICPAEFSFPASPKIYCLLNSSDNRLCPGFHLPHCSLETVSRLEGGVVVGLTLFPFSRSLCSELSRVQCLEINHRFIRFAQFTSCWR